MEKVSKAAVNYREAEGRERCGNCGMYKPFFANTDHRGKCDLVLGDIYAEDVCTEWVAK